MLESVKQGTDSYKVTIDSPLNLDVMNPEDCSLIIKRYAEKNKCAPKLAAIAITLLVQNGGTNTSKKSLKRIVEDKEFTLEDLRTIIKEVDKTGTVRKFAKGIRSIIIEIAKTNSWSGPLRNNLKINNPNLEIKDEYSPWCLEIQSDNPDCPSVIKEALIRREEQLKIAQGQAISSSKPRNQRGKKQNKKRK